MYQLWVLLEGNTCIYYVINKKTNKIKSKWTRLSNAAAEVSALNAASKVS